MAEPTLDALGAASKFLLSCRPVDVPSATRWAVHTENLALALDAFAQQARNKALEDVKRAVEHVRLGYPNGPMRTQLGLIMDGCDALKSKDPT